MDGLVSAGDADEEIALLGSVDLRRQAVVRSEDMPCLDDASTGGACDAVDVACDATGGACRGAEITMSSYAPNSVRFNYKADKQVVAVFSEIFHPSWKATLQGEPLPLFRADWVLRAAVLPEGSGEIVMRYEPVDYVKGETISRICSILLVLLMIGIVAVKLSACWIRTPSQRECCQGADNCGESR